MRIKLNVPKRISVTMFSPKSYCPPHGLRIESELKLEFSKRVFFSYKSLAFKQLACGIYIIKIYTYIPKSL